MATKTVLFVEAQVCQFFLKSIAIKGEVEADTIMEINAAPTSHLHGGR